MKNNLPKCGILAGIFLGVVACTSDRNPVQEHYYLKGYKHLVFQDTLGNTVSPSQYIHSTTGTNNFRSYDIRDTSLTLVHRRSGEPYSGYIRTFHRNTYNLQGEYDEGKIFRLRYWHPNRTLGMDKDLKTGETKLWDSSGILVASISSGETYFYYKGTQRLKEIRADTIQSYFDMEGNLVRYTIITDSTITYYYSDGQPRLELPYMEGGSRNGMAKRWHENGQLQAIGEYKNGQQYGTWIEYDSLGNEIDREVFKP